MDKNLTTTKVTSDVQSLIDEIRTEIEEGKERAINAMEQEKRITYWNIGKHIKEHLLENADRADYGTSLVIFLGKELNISKSVLYDSIQFFEEYPNIFPPGGKLTWTHVRVLLRVPEKQVRERYQAKVIEEKLSVRDLRELVKKEKIKEKSIENLGEEQADDNAEQPPQRQTLKVIRGQPHTYRLQTKRGKTMVDLGFRTYVNSPIVNAVEGLSEDNVVQVSKSQQQYRFTNMDKGVVPYYTYKAYVIEVIDGDTIWVDIDLGFNTLTTQKLRLKGINSKELTTEDGQNAKQYIEDCLNQCEFIAVKTYWRDKFTRYLADIFFMQSEKDIAVIAEEGVYLNQELLDEWLAVKY